MNNDQWLVKLCSAQPTNEAELGQALSNMPLDELMNLDVAPTPGIDSVGSKIAFAEEMGREMAIENPRAMQAAEAQELVSALSDKEAVKLAQELGLAQEKTAFLGAIKGLAAKAITSSGGKAVINAASKNPSAALAMGGGLAGGMHSKATGGSFMGGAALGAGVGYGAARLGAGKAMKKGLGKAYGWGARANKSALGGGAVASSMGKNTSVKFLKTAYLNSDSKNEWLSQFEGTPLLQAALDMSKQELASETQDIEERAQQKAERAQENTSDSRYEEQDKLRLQKKDLELQLIAQRNGLVSEGGGEDPAAEEAPPAEAPPEEAAGPAEAAVESPAGQEAVQAIKEAATKLAFSPAFGHRVAKVASIPPFR